jgi:hypothetical protein
MARKASGFVGAQILGAARHLKDLGPTLRDTICGSLHHGKHHAERYPHSRLLV